MMKLLTIAVVVALVAIFTGKADAAPYLTKARAATEATRLVNFARTVDGIDGEWNSAGAAGCRRGNASNVYCPFWVYYAELDTTCNGLIVVTKHNSGRVRARILDIEPECI